MLVVVLKGRVGKGTGKVLIGGSYSRKAMTAVSLAPTAEEAAG